MISLTAANRRIHGFALGYAQISQGETSYIPRTLGEINHRKQKIKKVIKWKYGQR